MGIDPSRTERIHLGHPDPSRAPLSVEFSITDAGEWTSQITFGSVNPFRAVDLLCSAVEGVLYECDRLNVAIPGVLDQMRYHLHQVGGPAEMIGAQLEKWDAERRTGEQP